MSVKTIKESVPSVHKPSVSAFRRFRFVPVLDIIKIVNNTSALIKDKIHTHGLHGFCTYIKKHYVANYNSVCSINNCYVCQRYVVRQH